METLPISRFKATCLAVLEEVRRTGVPVLVTRRGQPIAEVVPPTRPAGPLRRLGGAALRGRILGDIVEPVAADSAWEALHPRDRRA